MSNFAVKKHDKHVQPHICRNCNAVFTCIVDFNQHKLHACNKYYTRDRKITITFATPSWLKDI
jgi:hypothetical protein